MALYPLYVPTSCRIEPRAERGIRTFERQGQDLFFGCSSGDWPCPRGRFRNAGECLKLRSAVAPPRLHIILLSRIVSLEMEFPFVNRGNHSVAFSFLDYIGFLGFQFYFPLVVFPLGYITHFLHTKGLVEG